MLKSEVAKLLRKCAAYDRRSTGEADVEAWFDVMSDLDFTDANEAISQHFRSSTEWLMPAHIRSTVKTMRKTRLEHVELAIPDADPDDTAAYLEALRANRTRTASGDRDAEATINAIDIGRMPDGPWCERHPDQLGRLCRSCRSEDIARKDER